MNVLPDGLGDEIATPHEVEDSLPRIQSNVIGPETSEEPFADGREPESLPDPVDRIPENRIVAVGDRDRDRSSRPGDAADLLKRGVVVHDVLQHLGEHDLVERSVPVRKPEDIARGKPWEELATARRTGRAQDEGWRVKKNGERFWARVVLTAVHDDEGHLRGFAKVTQDLTERRHAQNLEKAANNVNEFIAMLAHELRNPLAPIKMAVEVMAKAPNDAQTCEAMRQTIDRQSAQLARIVDDMIDIARITRGSLVIEHAPVELGDVVRRAVETAAPAIAAARHTLEVAAPAG